jgi:hypothetical protein
MWRPIPFIRLFTCLTMSGTKRVGGSSWRRWLRHYATSQKVAGSIVHSHNPFDSTMALGSTQPLIKMSTRNISWVVKAADV